MSAPLQIADQSRDGLLRISDTNWDHNGTLRVTVTELIGSNCWTLPQDKLIAKARRFARRALMYPEKTTGSRLVRTWHAEGSQHFTFAVTRLPR
jgi:hypothetical protein